jgi:hypothetical protein
LSFKRDFNEIGGLLAEMITIINSLFSSISRALELVACDRIVPVYTLAIYDGACHYSVQAQFWVFSSSVIMGAFGLLMILFRAAYKPTLYVTTERDRDGNRDEGHEVEYEMPMPRKNNSFEDESLTPNAHTRHANAY